MWSFASTSLPGTSPDHLPPPFVPPGSSPPTPKGEKVAAALAVGCSVPAQGHNALEFSLAWDMPTVTFGSHERKHDRCSSLTLSF